MAAETRKALTPKCFQKRAVFSASPKAANACSGGGSMAEESPRENSFQHRMSSMPDRV